MPIEFPLTPEMIREEMKRIISDIREETNWELKRDLSDVTIEIGDAPEYGPMFGVVRTNNKIVFGSWLEDLRPKYYRVNLVEFIIIRESIVNFVEKSLLNENNQTLPQYMLEICSLSYMKKIHEKRTFETKLINVRNRFLFGDEELNDEEREFYNKIYSITNNVISQKITYNHFLETFLHFLEEGSLTEFDEGEIIDHIYRYFSNIPEDIVAPIRIKPNTLQVLEKVVELGFDATAINISKILGKDHTTIYREFDRIANRYNAYLRTHINFYKLGLHLYFILVRLKTDEEDNMQRALDELSKVRYIGEIYEGVGEKCNYLYSITFCPHFIADSLANKFERLMKNNVIETFEFKPLTNRIYMTSFVEARFEPTLDNYRKLLNEEIKCVKIKTWDNNNLKQDPPLKFSEKELNMLKTISVYKSHSLVNPQSYRVFTAQLKQFAVEQGVDINKMDDFLSFMNTQRNQLLENDLIGFRLELTISDLAINDILVLKVSCNPEDEKILKLINKLSIFSWISFFILHDEIVIQIFGLNSDHVITKIITELITEFRFDFEKFTANSKVWRFIPYADLYHVKGNKWSLF
ncbi:MAG: hypothetical protein FK733_06080 [Asgard group archaeon]|nr:hypothetical protein [Asgard group archaeon]